MVVEQLNSVKAQWCYSWGNALFSLRWKGKWHSLSQREADLYRQKFPPLVAD